MSDLCQFHFVDIDLRARETRSTNGGAVSDASMYPQYPPRERGSRKKKSSLRSSWPLYPF